jgi:type II secretory pathway pseudopilin PulG
MTKKRKCFSLVEILVSISVFAVIISIVSGFFISSLKVQNSVFMRQEILSEVSYVMEYVSRAIRMATKDTNGDCIGVNENYALSGTQSNNYGGEIVTTGSMITFRDYSGNCKRFYQNNLGQLIEDRKSPGGNWYGVKLISNEINVLDVIFTLRGEDQLDSDQPRITFIIKAREKDASASSLSKTVKIQTSVSQRNINVRR